MFERVFGDGCKKVPKSNDVRFRAPLEALREALDVVDTLEERRGGKGRRMERRSVGVATMARVARAVNTIQMITIRADSDDETEYSDGGFSIVRGVEFCFLIGEHARTIRTEKNSEKNGKHARTNDDE